MTSRFASVLIAGLLAVGAAMPAAADDGDHDRARELYEHGEIHALHDMMRIAREHTPGEIVSVSLVSTNGKWVYRFLIVAADGQRTEVDVDAEAGAVIEPGGQH